MLRARGFKEVKDFIASLERPRKIIILVKAGAPVDQTIDQLMEFLEEGDLIIDGGNEWYENTERRRDKVKAKASDLGRWGGALLPCGSCPGRAPRAGSPAVLGLSGHCCSSVLAPTRTPGHRPRLFPAGGAVHGHGRLRR